MDQVSGGSNGNVPHRPSDPYFYCFTILEYLVICCWPCSIDTFDFIFGCFLWLLLLLFLQNTSLNLLSTASHPFYIEEQNVKCHNTCLEKSLNSKRVKLRYFFYMCLLSPISCWQVTLLWHHYFVRSMIDWQGIYRSQCKVVYWIFMSVKAYGAKYWFERKIII